MKFRIKLGIILLCVILGGGLAVLQNIKPVQAFPRTGLVLDLDFGNNNGAAAPLIYDASGFNRNATSTAGSTSPVCNSSACTFDADAKVSVASTGVFDFANISIAIKFTPTYAADDASQHFLFDGPPNVGAANPRIYAYKQAAAQGNNFMFLIKNVLANQITVLYADYSPYWFKDKENVFVFTGTSGNNNVWFNGHKVVSADGTAHTAGDITDFWIGDDGGGVGTNGRIKFLKIYNRILTDTEVASFVLSAETSVPTAPKGTAGAPRNGLVGHWNMDANDKSGSVYYDKSGGNNNATINSTPPITAGKIKEALNLQGNPHYASVASAPFNFGTGNFTASVWIKPNTAAATYSILDKYNTNAANDRGWFIFESADVIRASVDNGSADITGTAPIRNGTWYHVVLVRNGDNAYTYVNGVQDGTVAGISARSATSAASLYIGAEKGTSQFFNGAVDDVRIYNRAFSAAEVVALYNSVRINYINAPTRSNLVGYWNMDANDMSATGATLYDRSGQNNHGTVTGTTTSTGKIGQARTFNGTSNQISLTTTGFPTGAFGAMTVAFWANPSGTSGNLYLFEYGTCSANSQWGIIQAANAWQFSNCGTGDISSTTTPRIGRWDNIVTIYDGTKKYIYINGVLENDITYSSFNITDAAAQIGSYNGSGNWWPGSIDDFRIYNVALSAADVNNLYLRYKQNYTK